MSTAVKLSSEMIEAARPVAKVNKRSMAKQIEYWACLGKLAEDNPELPMTFLKGTLQGIAEIEVGAVEDYQFS